MLQPQAQDRRTSRWGLVELVVQGVLRMSLLPIQGCCPVLLLLLLLLLVMTGQLRKGAIDVLFEPCIWQLLQWRRRRRLLLLLLLLLLGHWGSLIGHEGVWQAPEVRAAADVRQHLSTALRISQQALQIRLLRPIEWYLQAAVAKGILD